MYANADVNTIANNHVQNAEIVLIVCANAVKKSKKLIIAVNLPKSDINTYNLIPERNQSVVNQKIGGYYNANSKKQLL